MSNFSREQQDLNDVQLRNEQWPDAVFVQIEQAGGGITLELGMRRHLQVTVEGYDRANSIFTEMAEIQRRLRKRLKGIHEILRQTIQILASSETAVGLAFQRAQLTPEDIINKLQMLCDSSNDFDKQLKKIGRPPNLALPPTLMGLSSIFIQAGGQWQKVRRVEGEKGQPFIEFAFGALMQASGNARPQSQDALAKSWLDYKLEQGSQPLTTHIARIRRLQNAEDILRK